MAGVFRRFTKRFFVICNVAVALLFLLASYGANLGSSWFWPLGLLTLGALFILLILVIFAFFWLVAKPRMVFISLAAILLAWGPIRQILAFHSSSENFPAKDGSFLRVMSWNVAHFNVAHNKEKPDVKEGMFTLINKYEPDVACFQEMVASDINPQAINYLPEFLKRLNFSYAHYAYNPKLDFDADHHFGIVIFSRYPLINKQMIVHDRGDYNSIFQYADMVRGTDTFRIFNLHLQSLRFSEQNISYLNDPEMSNSVDIKKSRNIVSKLKQGFLRRERQSNYIKEEIGRSPYPVIVCGDFNDAPNSYAYKTIGSGLHNAFADKGSGIGRTFNGISPTLRIDNIFLDERLKTLRFARVKKELSDHFPILADVASGN